MSQHDRVINEVRPAARHIGSAPPSAAGRTHRREFLSYVHSLRGLAIAGVVAIHLVESFGWLSSTNPCYRAIAGLLGNATVPFVFVSGFLFQHLSDGLRYGEYLRKRWTTVAVPYVLVSIPTLVHQAATHAGVFAGVAGEHPLRAVAMAYLTGAHMAAPFWYIPVILLFYLAAPLWLQVDRRPGWYWLIVPLLLTSTFLHRSYAHRVVWQSVLYFLPPYLAGMAASRHRERVLGWMSRHRWWVLGVTAALFAAEPLVNSHWGPVFSQSPFSRERGTVDLDLSVKLGLTLLALEALRRHDRALAPRLSGLADTSFAIFFLHGFVLQRLAVHLRWPGSAASLLAPPAALLGLAGVLLVCVIAARLTQRVLGSKSRFLIGC